MATSNTQRPRVLRRSERTIPLDGGSVLILQHEVLDWSDDDPEQGRSGNGWDEDSDADLAAIIHRDY